MSSTIKSAVLIGVDAVEVTITVEILNRLPAVQIVGLPAAAVRETAERVRSAIEASGWSFPRQRVVVNITDADLPKHGAGLDLPIALCILSEIGALTLGKDAFAIGELSLNGDIRGVRGAFPLAMAARDVAIVPVGNSREAAEAISARRVAPVNALRTAEWYLGGKMGMRELWTRIGPVLGQAQALGGYPDFAEIYDMEAEKRALTIAAVGGHSLTLVGPAGCGKSMLARRLVGLLPPLSATEERQTYKIYSAAGLTSPLYRPQRPFRAPHHSVSLSGLTGSTTGACAPGEVTLAHGGVLLLDDAPEFTRTCLGAVFDVHEAGMLSVQRSWGSVMFPTCFQLVLTAMDCPCGKPEACTCTADQVRRYKSRVPKTDITVRLKPRPRLAPGFSMQRGESSAVIVERVIGARGRLARLPKSRYGRVESVAASVAAWDGYVTIGESQLEEARSLCGEP